MLRPLLVFCRRAKEGWEEGTKVARKEEREGGREERKAGREGRRKGDGEKGGIEEREKERERERGGKKERERGRGEEGDVDRSRASVVSKTRYRAHKDLVRGDSRLGLGSAVGVGVVCDSMMFCASGWGVVVGG